MAKKKGRRKKHKGHKKHGLDPVRVGLAVGIFESLTLMVLALLSNFGFGVTILHMIASVFQGYSGSLLGIVRGGIWGLIDGFIGGYVFALIWNWLENKSIRNFFK